MTVSHQTLRGYELREGRWWAELGFRVDVAWKEARPIAPGRTVWKRRDFLGHFDVMAVYPSRPVALALVQVTATPFVDVRPSREGYQNAGAGHGAAPFSWPMPGGTVERWAVSATMGLLVPSDPALVQVIVSYSNARHPERRWWSP